jgi:hypothetical protein
MATLKTALVVVSIGANIATAAYLISPRASQPERQANETPPSAGVPVAFASNGGVDAAAVRQLLMQQGFSDHETKLVVLGLLNAAALDRAASVPYEYWRADDARSTASRIEAAEQRGEATRKTLVALYGRAAQDDPVFATAFRPLQERLPFLSSEQQIALRRLQLEQRPAAVQTMGGPRPANMTGPPERASSTAGDAAIREVLADESTYREYAMRESPLAHRLRSTGVEFTESEYRAVFELMDGFSAGANPSAFVAQREGVRKVLGRERALELWAATDPLFQAINQTAQKHGLSESSILGAYEAVVAAQDDLLRMTSSVRDPQQGQQIRERIEQRDSTLRSLVGDAAASAVIEAVGARLGGPRFSSNAPPFPR